MTGASAWLLSDGRNGHATRVQLELVSGRRFHLSSDGRALSALPLDGNATPDEVIVKAEWPFTDGRLPWPTILEHCADWELGTPDNKGRVFQADGIGSNVLSSKTSSRPPSGTRFTFTPDLTRLTGTFTSPETLAALHTQAAKWPGTQFIVRVPSSAATPGSGSSTSPTP